MRSPVLSIEVTSTDLVSENLLRLLVHPKVRRQMEEVDPELQRYKKAKN